MLALRSRLLHTYDHLSMTPAWPRVRTIRASHTFWAARTLVSLGRTLRSCSIFWIVHARSFRVDEGMFHPVAYGLSSRSAIHRPRAPYCGRLTFRFLGCSQIATHRSPHGARDVALRAHLVDHDQKLTMPYGSHKPPTVLALGIHLRSSAVSFRISRSTPHVFTCRNLRSRDVSHAFQARSSS